MSSNPSSTCRQPIGRGARAVDARHPKYQEIKAKVHQDLLNRLNLERLTRVRREDAEPEIRGLIVGLLEKESHATPLSLFEREALIADVINELFGLGPLEAFLRDPAISDILVNRHNQIYVEREGKIEESDVVFKDDKHLMQIIERIVSSVGRRIDESSPMVDARLADGSRVNAIIPPLALDGPTLSIRRFRTDRLGAQDLVERNSMTQPMLDFLKAAVGAKLNIIVSGGTGAGKTTLLNVLSSFIGDRERVITIEDAAELMLRQRHVVRLETRPANIEGKGAVRQRELVINALRMRPDRIVVGEVRGEEALDMLQAMNTGPRRQPDDHSRQQRARRAVPARHDGRDGQPERARQGDPPAGGVGGQRDRPGLAHVGRHPQGHRRLGSHGDGRRRDHDAGPVPVRAHRAHAGRARHRDGSAPRASGPRSARRSRRRVSRCPRRCSST